MKSTLSIDIETYLYFLTKIINIVFHCEIPEYDMKNSLLTGFHITLWYICYFPYIFWIISILRDYLQIDPKKVEQNDIKSR